MSLRSARNRCRRRGGLSVLPGRRWRIAPDERAGVERVTANVCLSLGLQLGFPGPLPAAVPSPQPLSRRRERGFTAATGGLPSPACGGRCPEGG
ncbi:hypothetical protein XFF6990_70024 [Xanthomonas citri pv. fuscans]|nr:hypothetical protein XFF6990_70024 [Xanthomonas citri pv. fuscans]